MPVTVTGKIDQVEIITSVQRRRRWSAEEKARIVQETWAPGMSVSLVARQHGIAPNQVFTWRRLYAEGALSAVGAGEEVVPASEYRALQHQVRELQRLLGRSCATRWNWCSQKNGCCGRPRRYGTTRHEGDSRCPRGRALQSRRADGSTANPPASRTASAARGGAVAEIEALIANQPTYGYRRIHALLRRQRREPGGATVNVKRVYRVMKTHGLLLERHTGNGEERRHDGRVAVDHPNTRWCSDGFEIGCDNDERVRIAFTLDCCDREAISWVATTGGINSGDIRDLLLESIECRFGLVTRLPMPIEWLSDNGSPYTARETRAFADKIGLVPRTTPIESPGADVDHP